MRVGTRGVAPRVQRAPGARAELLDDDGAGKELLLATADGWSWSATAARAAAAEVDGRGGTSGGMAAPAVASVGLRSPTPLRTARLCTRPHTEGRRRSARREARAACTLLGAAEPVADSDGKSAHAARRSAKSRLWSQRGRT